MDFEFFTNRINKASHLYIDSTFITTKEYKQLLIIMFYDEFTNKKIPVCYILLNNKYECGYLKALETFKRIISLENTIYLNIKSITTDFEIALINAINLLFPKIHHIGCLFHFVQALRRKIGNLGLLKKEFDHKEFLKDLSSIPFLYNKNKNIINNIFEIYEKKYNKKNDILQIIKSYKAYFINQWNSFFINGSLNYYNLKKYQRSNSYIENYNRRIKNELGKF